MTNGETFDWPPLEALPEHQDPLPFPSDALPTTMRAFIEAEATARQVPVDMVGMLALSAISAALQGRLNAVAQHGQWVEPTNIYTATSLVPGERKSSVHSDLFMPLREWERDQIALETEIVSASRAEHAALEKDAERCLRELTSAMAAERDARNKQIDPTATSGDVDNSRRAYEKAQADFDNHVPIFHIKLTFDDLTEARAASALDQQREAIAIVSAEGGPLKVLAAARYNTPPQLDIFLKGHSGDYFALDRQTDQRSIRLESPRMTFGLAFQPSILHGLKGAGELHGQGLLGRFLWCLPTPMMGRRIQSPPQVSDPIKQQLAATLSSIATAARSQYPDRANVLLTPEADALRMDHETRLEPLLAPEDGELSPIADWASKLNGALVRIAALIATWRAGGIPEQIDDTDMAAALRFDPYLRSHAWRAYAAMGIIENRDLDTKILNWIRGHDIREFVASDAKSGVWPLRTLKPPEIDEALGPLCSSGHLKRQIVSTHPFRVQWAVNPAVHAEVAA